MKFRLLINKKLKDELESLFRREVYGEPVGIIRELNSISYTLCGEFGWMRFDAKRKPLLIEEDFYCDVEAKNDHSL